MRIRNLVKSLLFLSLVFGFSCSKKKPEPSAARDYIKAYELLQDGGYYEAAQDFEKIEDNYPFSYLAPKAQIMASYAYYLNEDYPEVDRLVADFVRINPNHENIDYMIYLQAMGYYNKIPKIDRAQDPTREASKLFRELKARFSDSKYAKDASKKLVMVDEHLAGAKMSVGRHQMMHSNYVGAIKNFQEVIYRYARTNQAPEAYYRLFEIYYKLGIDAEAEKALFKLVLQYYDSEWTQKAQKLKNEEK